MIRKCITSFLLLFSIAVFGQADDLKLNPQRYTAPPDISKLNPPKHADTISKEFASYLNAIFEKGNDTVLIIDTSAFYSVQYESSCSYNQMGGNWKKIDSLGTLCLSDLKESNNRKKVSLNRFVFSNDWIDSLPNKTLLGIKCFGYRNLEYGVLDSWIQFASFNNGKTLIISETYSSPDNRGSAPDSYTRTYFCELIEDD